MAGRRPKPTALRELNGNAGHRPANKAEPKPHLGAAEPPEWLPESGRRFWHELEPMLLSMRVLTEADRPALVALAAVYAIWRRAFDVIWEEGTSYEAVTEHGTMMRRRPEATDEADAWRRFRSMLIEFGLTPAARSRVSASAGGEKDDDPVETWLNAR